MFTWLGMLEASAVGAVCIVLFFLVSRIWGGAAPSGLQEDHLAADCTADVYTCLYFFFKTDYGTGAGLHPAGKQADSGGESWTAE